MAVHMSRKFDKYDADPYEVFSDALDNTVGLQVANGFAEGVLNWITPGQARELVAALTSAINYLEGP